MSSFSSDLFSSWDSRGCLYYYETTSDKKEDSHGSRSPGGRANGTCHSLLVLNAKIPRQVRKLSFNNKNNYPARYITWNRHHCKVHQASNSPHSSTSLATTSLKQLQMSGTPRTTWEDLARLGHTRRAIFLLANARRGGTMANESHLHLNNDFVDQYGCVDWFWIGNMCWVIL